MTTFYVLVLITLNTIRIVIVPDHFSDKAACESAGVAFQVDLKNAYKGWVGIPGSDQVGFSCLQIK
jgi:hypothetical protein